MYIKYNNESIKNYKKNNLNYNKITKNYCSCTNLYYNTKSHFQTLSKNIDYFIKKKYKKSL